MTKLPKPASKTLLHILVASGQTTFDVLDILSNYKNYRSAYLRGGPTYVNELRNIKKTVSAQIALRSLARSKYIKAQKIGKRLTIALTEKGKTVYLAEQLRNAKLNPQKFYTVVIFDIPETQRLARRQLRLLLRQGGFIKLQQSVWVSKADTYELMSKLIRELKLQAWVNIYHAANFLKGPK